MTDKFESLQKRVETILNDDDYDIKMTPELENYPPFPSDDTELTFDFKIIDQAKSKNASNLIIILRKDEVYNTILTRSATPVLTVIFYVKTLFTDPDYVGRSLATLLMIYGLSTLKIKYTNIEFALLDDCSKNSKSMDKNIYHKLGFFTIHHTKLMDNYPRIERIIKINDSEKQLLLDDNFISRANKRLDNIANPKQKNAHKGGNLKNHTKNKKTKNKTQKTKHKKQNTKNKTQKTKNKKQNTKKQKSS
jgi:hypothetical protein